MLRLAYSLALAFCGAVLVHISIVFLIPRMDFPETTKQIQALQKTTERLVLRGDAEIEPVAGLDPFFRYRLCEFDLADGSFLLTSAGNAPFFSATLVSENGTILFSITDRQTIDRKLNLEVNSIASHQALGSESTESSGLPDVVPVFVAESKGYAIVRAFVPDSSWDEIVDSFLNDIECAAVESAS